MGRGLGLRSMGRRSPARGLQTWSLYCLIVPLDTCMYSMYVCMYVCKYIRTYSCRVRSPSCPCPESGLSRVRCRYIASGACHRLLLPCYSQWSSGVFRTGARLFARTNAGALSVPLKSKGAARPRPTMSKDKVKSAQRPGVTGGWFHPGSPMGQPTYLVRKARATQL